MGALDKAMAIITKRFEDIQLMYIEKAGSQIQKIGKLSQVNINRLTVLSEVNADIAEITRELQKAAQVSASDLARIYKEAEQDVLTDPRFSRLVSGGQLPQDALDRLEQYTREITYQTAGQLTNLSNTTAIDQQYRDAIDDALLAASSGLEGYVEATRQVVRDLGGNGIKVVYASGYRRRLDSSVRQNITNGVHPIAQQ